MRYMRVSKRTGIIFAVCIAAFLDGGVLAYGLGYSPQVLAPGTYVVPPSNTVWAGNVWDDNGLTIPRP